MMRILKPGDPCPCCGQPLPEGLPAKQMLYISWVAEGMTLGSLAEAMEEEADAQ